MKNKANQEEGTAVADVGPDGRIEVLRIHSDPRLNFFAVYFRNGSCEIGKIVLHELVAEVESTVKGIIDTERYLKGDPVAQPSPDIVHETEESEFFFERVMLDRGEEITEEKQDMLNSLQRERESLNESVLRFRNFALAYDAGVAQESDSELVSLISSIVF